MKRPDLPIQPGQAQWSQAQSAEPSVSTQPGKLSKPAKPKVGPKSKKPAKAKSPKSEQTAKPAKTVDPAKAARKEIRANQKRRKSEIRSQRRRFTALSRRRRWMIGSGAAVILVLFVAVFGVAYSPLMAVKTIEVTGANSIDPAQLQSALAGELGTPLPLVNPDDIAKALSAFPVVQSFTTESVPPSTLVVRIVERTPIGSVKSDAGFDLIDSAGVVISTTPEAPAGVPVLEVDDTKSEAFKTLGTMLLALPADLRGRAVSAGATTTDDAWFQLADGPKIIWGDANNTALKLTVVQKLLAVSGDASEINVASPNAPFTR